MRKLRLVVGAVVVLGLIAVGATAASAHVTVNPSEAEQGSYTKLTFRVPTESDTASTISLKVQLPPDHPFASVSVKPEPGWTYNVTKTQLSTPISSDDGQITEAVSTIDWTGGSIKPGEFGEFEISVGPLPTDTDQLAFKAIQGYSDNTTVDWIETSTPGGPEPDHPAPVLTLTKATDDTGAATDTPTTVSTSASTATGDSELAAKVSTAQDDANTNKTLAIVGIIVGLLGLIVAIGAVLLARRRSVTP